MKILFDGTSKYWVCQCQKCFTIAQMTGEELAGNDSMPYAGGGMIIVAPCPKCGAKINFYHIGTEKGRDLIKFARIYN